MAAAHGCVVADERRAMSTASHSQQRKPQRALVAGEHVFIHRRKGGAQEWCGPGVCVLSEEPKPGRNETVWVHMRNCLHKCNRTQVRPATNEEAEGIVLRWKGTDTGRKAKVRWCVHGFEDPDIHEIERSCPTPELSSIKNYTADPGATTSEGMLADGEKASMQGDPSVRDEPLYATPPPEGLPGVTEGALIRLDREV